MSSRGLWACLLVFSLTVTPFVAQGQTSASSSKPSSHSEIQGSTSLDPGTLTNGIYRNRQFGFACKIPAGWVLRTEEMNARDENESSSSDQSPQLSGSAPSAKADGQNQTGPNGRVLLAAFSRPPQALGEDVNPSVLIAAESIAAYPGLKEPVQYFGPLAEVAKAQGFTEEGEPYEVAVGAKALVRQDFRKNVGSRVMRQSSLVMLARGCAVSFTFIAGTEEELEELVNELTFVPSRKIAK